MKERLLIALCLPVGLVGGAIGAKLMGASDGASSTPLRAESATENAAPISQPSAELARLSARIDELVQRVDTLADQRRAAPVGREDGEGLAAASVAVLPGTTTPPNGTEPVDLASDADWLVFADPNATLDARQAAWASLRARGLLGEALALAEARAAAAPDDPRAQFDLGVGYIEKIQEVTGIEAGSWATKADKAFDRTLALDEEHLDARLYKAMSLSFWPPIFGKRAEAIAQFETLIEKQAAHPAQDHFANSYTLLGNLHMESGNAAKALEVWKAGAAAFPDDADLAAKIAAAGGS